MGLSCGCVEHFVHNRVIKRIRSNLSEVRREKREERREKKEKKKSDEGMKNAWNYHGICITARFQARAAGANSCRSLALPYPSIAIDTATLRKCLFLLEWQRHLLRSTAERETTARSSSIAPANSYTWNVDRCYLNCRGLTRTTENSIVYIRVIYGYGTYMDIFHGGYDSSWPFRVRENTFVFAETILVCNFRVAPYDFNFGLSEKSDI